MKKIAGLWMLLFVLIFLISFQITAVEVESTNSPEIKISRLEEVDIINFNIENMSVNSECITTIIDRVCANTNANNTNFNFYDIVSIKYKYDSKYIDTKLSANNLLLKHPILFGGGGLILSGIG